LGEDTYSPAVSRHGHKLAFVHETEDSDLWRTELASPQGPGKALEHVISSTRAEGAPRFSPDGKKIAYQSYRTGTPEIWVSDPDGSNAIQFTFLRTAKPEFPAWSPDGQTIAFAEGGKFHIVSSMGGAPRQISPTVDYFGSPSWSRDGRFVYYWRPQIGGETQIWKIAVNSGQTLQVTKNGGFSSMESPDGTYLYFTKQKSDGIWRMPVEGGEEALVLDRQAASLPGYWAVFDDGIYYVEPYAATQARIMFYSFAKRQSIPIMTIPGQLDEWSGGLTVSPDRRWIVFSQREYSTSEIILAENFR